MIRRLCRLMGRPLGPVLETAAAARALEESSVRDCNLVAHSTPRTGKSQTHVRRDLNPKSCWGNKGAIRDTQLVAYPS